MSEEKIKIRCSQRAYKHKPTKEEMRLIMWQMARKSFTKEVNYKQLAWLIKQGHSTLLAEYDDVDGVGEKNIKMLNCIALDVDSKENKITMKEMVQLLDEDLKIKPVVAYRTFSDTDNTKFRLIYRFESPVDVETYRNFYMALQLKYNKYLDQQTKNANRVWAGTDKQVFYNGADKVITFSLLLKMINWYEKKVKKQKEVKKIEVKKGYVDFDNKDYIRPEYKKDVVQLLISNIDLKDFLENKMGARLKPERDSFVGCCPIHKGDNDHAFVVTNNIWTCFTRCNKTGNLLTVAKEFYKINNFSHIAFSLARDYNINIPEKFIRRVY